MKTRQVERRIRIASRTCRRLRLELRIKEYARKWPTFESLAGTASSTMQKLWMALLDSGYRETPEWGLFFIKSTPRDGDDDRVFFNKSRSTK